MEGYYNHIAKIKVKEWEILKKKLYGIVDLKPILKREESVIAEYYMTEKEEDDENFGSVKPYGIEVIKKQKIDGITYREVKRVDDVSDCVEEINNLLSILHKNSVTPIAVSDVLEDLAVK